MKTRVDVMHKIAALGDNIPTIARHQTVIGQMWETASDEERNRFTTIADNNNLKRLEWHPEDVFE